MSDDFPGGQAATLRGFNIHVFDVDDTLHLQHPILSFASRPDALYVADYYNWRGRDRSLRAVDADESEEMATLLGEAHRRPIASGEGVVVTTLGFAHAAAECGCPLDGEADISFVKCQSKRYWAGTATQNRFAALREHLTEKSCVVFDEELARSVQQHRELSSRGVSALLILRRCGPRKREDIAVRQLAAAERNRDAAPRQKLLTLFSLELKVPKEALQRKTAEMLDQAMARPL